MASQQKKWIMNAFGMGSPSHLAPGLWQHPRDKSKDNNQLEYWIELAKVLEDGKFHGIFIADVLGIYDVYKGPGNIAPALKGAASIPIIDPFMVIPVMASVTKKLGFGLTASTTYENPYALARKFSTLDHITNGRIGWNVVTSFHESAAKSYGLTTQVEHDERYAIAEEFMEVFYKLVEGSWRDDAVVRDLDRRIYADPDRVRLINHKGKNFSSAGPNLVAPSVQRTPLLFQAGASSAGKKFATKHTEAMFLPGMDPNSVAKVAKGIREGAAASGRDPQSIKLLAGCLIVVDETDETAQAKYEEYLSYADLDGAAALFGGWTGTDLGKLSDDEDLKFSGNVTVQSIVNAWSATIPNSGGIKWTKRRVLQELAMGGAHAKIIGSPTTVADKLQEFIDLADVDGFNLSYAVSPGTYEDMVKYLWPELKKRGVLWDDYPAETIRENYLMDGKGPRLRDDHPGAKYKWSAGEDIPAYAKAET